MYIIIYLLYIRLGYTALTTPALTVCASQTVIWERSLDCCGALYTKNVSCSLVYTFVSSLVYSVVLSWLLLSVMPCVTLPCSMFHCGLYSLYGLIKITCTWIHSPVFPSLYFWQLATILLLGKYILHDLSWIWHAEMTWLRVILLDLARFKTFSNADWYITTGHHVFNCMKTCS